MSRVIHFLWTDPLINYYDVCKYFALSFKTVNEFMGPIQRSDFLDKLSNLYF
jgi:hypothetical protein